VGFPARESVALGGEPQFVGRQPPIPLSPTLIPYSSGLRSSYIFRAPDNLGGPLHFSFPPANDSGPSFSRTGIGFASQDKREFSTICIRNYPGRFSLTLERKCGCSGFAGQKR
jgi:hypothetical protein